MKKILIVGAGAMGAAFSIPLLDNGHSVALTEPYNLKLLEKLHLIRYLKLRGKKVNLIIQ